MKTKRMLTALLGLGLFLITSYPLCSSRADLITAYPSWINQIGQTENVLLKKGYLDVTLYNNWNGNTVDPTGVRDSTLALQKAIRDAIDFQLVAFFPNQSNGSRGVYLISNMLSAKMPNPGVSGDQQPSGVIMGSKAGGVRPLIRLAAGAAGFQDPNAPKPMIWMWSLTWMSMGDPPRYQPIPSDDPYTQEPDIAFYQTYRGVDLDLNGNPGSIGLSAPGAQGAVVEDVTINATGGVAGLWNNGADGPTNYNIEVIGGRSAFLVDTRSMKYAIYNGTPHFVGSRFINQTETVIRILGNQASPLSCTGCYIKNVRPIPFNLGVTERGGFGFVDGVVDIAGGTLLQGLTGFYLRDVYVRGVDNVINGWPITDKANWTWIKEYSHPEGPNYPNIINGQTNNLDYKDKVEGIVATDSQLINALVAKHQYDYFSLPDFEDTNVLNAKLDCGAQGNNSANDLNALQSCINQAHAQGKTVFLPRGKYLIGGQLLLKADSKVFGPSKHETIIAPHPSWRPSSEAVEVTTENDASGTTYFADIAIRKHSEDAGGNGVVDCPGSQETCDQFNFTSLEWRVGRNSILKDVSSGMTDNYTQGHPFRKFHGFRVNANGGGRWYAPLNYFQSGNYNGHSGGRGLLIENSVEPMWIYAWCGDNISGNTEIEIVNSQNKFFYFQSGENWETQNKISNSRNIGFFTTWKSNASTMPGLDISGSDNIFASIFSTRFGVGGTDIQLREVYGGTTLQVVGKNIQLFKRGDLEHTAITPALRTPAAPGSLHLR